jgi:hypothetical protein
VSRRTRHSCAQPPGRAPGAVEEDVRRRDALARGFGVELAPGQLRPPPPLEGLGEPAHDSLRERAPCAGTVGDVGPAVVCIGCSLASRMTRRTQGSQAPLPGSTVRSRPRRRCLPLSATYPEASGAIHGCAPRSSARPARPVDTAVGHAGRRHGDHPGDRAAHGAGRRAVAPRSHACRPSTTPASSSATST